MDTAVQRALNDKLYDKRKVGALESVSPPPPPRPSDRSLATTDIVPGSSGSYASLLLQRTMTRLPPFLTSCATSMPMLSISPTLGMEDSSAWPLPP